MAKILSAIFLFNVNVWCGASEKCLTKGEATS